MVDGVRRLQAISLLYLIHTRYIYSGCFSAPYAIALYAQAFEQVSGSNLKTDSQLLENFRKFLCLYGSEHYGLNPRGKNEIELIEEHAEAVKEFLYDSESNEHVVPLFGGEILKWSTRISSE